MSLWFVACLNPMPEEFPLKDEDTDAPVGAAGPATGTPDNLGGAGTGSGVVTPGGSDGSSAGAGGSGASGGAGEADPGTDEPDAGAAPADGGSEVGDGGI